jgi:ABC-type amino acid transport substrate-binding protein
MGASMLRWLALAIVLTATRDAGAAPLASPGETLRVLVVLDLQRPEFFSDNPAAPGFDREIIESFAVLHRLKLEVVTLSSWDEILPALLRKRGDVIVGGYRDTEARRREIAFTREVFPTRWVVVTRKPHRAVLSLQELRTERVATMKGTSMADGLTALGIPFTDIPVGSFASALRTGQATAVVWSIERAMGGRREDPDLQFGLFFGDPGSLAFGVRKEDAALRQALDDHLANLRRSGGWNRRAVKYFGSDVVNVLKVARGGVGN